MRDYRPKLIRDKGDTSVVAVIPARGGSKRLPRKNIVDVGGRPLIARSIWAARQCGLIDHVFVSTDDEEIRDVACEHGAMQVGLRPSELSGDDVTLTEVLYYELMNLPKRVPICPIDILVMLTPHPFIDGATVSRVVRRMFEKPIVDACFLGFSTHRFVWRKRKPEHLGLYERLAPDIPDGPGRLREKVFVESPIVCATRSECISPDSRVGDGDFVDIIENTNPLLEFDIHDELSLGVARWLMEARCMGE